jgi:DNA-binding CsgD family transcriptional regulator
MAPKKHIVFLFSNSQLFSETLCFYLDKFEDIVVSGISLKPTDLDKLFKLLRIDIVIIISHQTEYLNSIIEKLNHSQVLANILCIAPKEYINRKKLCKAFHNFEFVSHDDKLELISDKIHFLTNYRNSKLKIKKEHPLRDITPREYEILALIKKGKKNKEIAEEMFLSVKTVENHRTNILKKTKSKSMLGLINELHKHGHGY